MSDSYQNERLDEILREQTGGVTRTMWVGLTLAAFLAAAIIVLIHPGDQQSSGQETMALRGTPVETTGVSSTEPNEAVERRWPAAMDDK